jgi:MFS family permease
VERRSLLRPFAVPSFRLLWLSTLGSSFGTLLAAVALAIDVKDRTDSGPWVGALFVVEFLPAILIGLSLGPLVDRLSRRGVMVGSDVVRAAVFCALPFATAPGAIVGLAAVAGVATGFFRPAAYAGVPNLVPEDELPHANALLQGVENVSWTLGPLLGGIVTAAWGPHTTYWVNAASFLLSAGLIARIPRRLLQSATAISKGHWRDLREGAAVVRGSRALVAVLVAWSVASLAIGIGNVGEVFLAKDTFSAGDFGYGLVYGSVGLGLLAGTLLAPTLLRRSAAGATYAAGIGTLGLGFGLAAASPDVWVAAAFFVLAGFGNGVAGMCNTLLVQRGAPDHLRGRALTLVMGANFLALGVGMGAGGLLVDAAGARVSTATAAGVFAAAAAIALPLAPRVVPTPEASGERVEVAAKLAAADARSTGARL